MEQFTALQKGQMHVNQNSALFFRETWKCGDGICQCLVRFDRQQPVLFKEERVHEQLQLFNVIVGPLLTK